MFFFHFHGINEGSLIVVGEEPQFKAHCALQPPSSLPRISNKCKRMLGKPADIPCERESVRDLFRRAYAACHPGPGQVADFTACDSWSEAMERESLRTVDTVIVYAQVDHDGGYDWLRTEFHVTLGVGARAVSYTHLTLPTILLV